MTEKRGFWRWWLFSGDTEDIVFKLLFIYSSIATIASIMSLFLYPNIVGSLGSGCFVLAMIHGWIISLFLVFFMLVKTTYEEYKDTLKK